MENINLDYNGLIYMTESEDSFNSRLGMDGAIYTISHDPVKDYEDNEIFKRKKIATDHAREVIDAVLGSIKESN